MKQHKDYYFIYESPHFVEYSDLEIISEQAVPDSDFKKLKFRALLQDANTINGNKRRYSNYVLGEIVNQLKQKAGDRGLYMEMDHPFVASTEADVIKKRAVIIEIKNSCALLTDIELIDNQVYGTVETLSNNYGRDLYNLIQYDKAKIGFSLRALGALKPLPDGTFEVTLPIRAVTYDVVCNPSHKAATIVKFLPESATEFADLMNSTVLTENDNLDYVDDNMITICNGGVCVRRFLDDVITEMLSEKLSKFELSL